jgi:hypothetical protein
MEVYDVDEDEDMSCCGPCYIATHYPCGYYQMLISLREWREDSKKDVPVIGGPSSSGQSRIFRVALPESAEPGTTINVFLPEPSLCVDVPVPQHLPNPVGPERYVDVAITVPAELPVAV